MLCTLMPIVFAEIMFSIRATITSTGTRIRARSHVQRVPSWQALVKTERAEGLTLTTVPKPAVGPNDVLIEIQKSLSLDQGTT